MQPLYWDRHRRFCDPGRSLGTVFGDGTDDMVCFDFVLIDEKVLSSRPIALLLSDIYTYALTDGACEVSPWRIQVYGFLL